MNNKEQLNKILDSFYNGEHSLEIDKTTLLDDQKSLLLKLIIDGIDLLNRSHFCEEAQREIIQNFYFYPTLEFSSIKEHFHRKNRAVMASSFKDFRNDTSKLNTHLFKEISTHNFIDYPDIFALSVATCIKALINNHCDSTIIYEASNLLTMGEVLQANTALHSYLDEVYYSANPKIQIATAKFRPFLNNLDSEISNYILNNCTDSFDENVEGLWLLVSQKNKNNAKFKVLENEWNSYGKRVIFKLYKEEIASD